VFRRLVDVQCRPVAWPEDAPPDVPPWLVKLILALLAIEPRERPPTTAALLERLQAPAPATVMPPPVLRAEELQPRAIGVLPLENTGGAPDDEWLGYAIANFISRALAELPDVYVADQDGLVAMLGRLDTASWPDERARLREAGRRVGAGTIITGRFARTGPTLQIQAEVLRGAREEAATIGRVEGPLAQLADLERALLETVRNALGASQTTGKSRSTVTLEAREKFTRGRQAFLQGAYDEAIALGEKALQQAPEYGDAISLLGVCLARLGRYEEAEARHRAQQDLAHRDGDERREIEALANLGVMKYYRGEYAAAESLYARAAELAERLGLATEHAQICNNLGFALFRSGRLAEAEQAYLKAIETHRAYGGLTSLVGPYSGMGNVLAEQQRYGEARAYYERALALATETGDRTSVGTTHMHIGRCAVHEARFADAKHEFTMALNALEETRFWNGLARAYEYIAEMHVQLGDFAEAARCADKRIELARQHANVRMEAAAWLQKADALARAGQGDEAAACRAAAAKLGDTV
jgi:tetratricopeptide (TPR) repeat protein